MILFKYSILYGFPNQPTGILERTMGVVKAPDFSSALYRILDYYNNYIITSVQLVKIDDIIEVDDIKEI